MTPIQQIREIMREERERSMESIYRLPFSDDAVPLWQSIQTAINNCVGERDRVIDARAVPAVLDLMGDEMRRIAKRLIDAGLAPPTE